MAAGVYIGTSGWTYDDWQGPFYPPEVKGAQRLAYYAGRFNSVEVNATFYRLPTAAMIKAWNRRLGPGFHLVLKGSRFITHRKKLRDCGEPLARFLERAGQLKRLEVILWQLPPTLQRDLPRLRSFLAALPARPRQALEFRHASWWHPGTVEALAAHQAAFVALSHPRLPDDIIPTGDMIYLRLHGLGPRLYQYDYSEKELADWARRLKPLLTKRRLYAFFNNDFQARAPANALVLARLLAAKD